MNLYDLVIPLGIATFALVSANIVLGMVKKILPPKTRLLVHKILGLVLLGTAALHASIVLYFKLFAG